MKTLAQKKVLHHALVGLDCKKRQTQRDTQAKLTKKKGAVVGTDCIDNSVPRRGFWKWLMS